MCATLARQRDSQGPPHHLIALDTVPRRPLSLELSDKKSMSLKYGRTSQLGIVEIPFLAGLKDLPSSPRCRANMAHVRQSRPDSGLGFQVKFV